MNVREIVLQTYTAIIDGESYTISACEEDGFYAEFADNPGVGDYFTYDQIDLNRDKFFKLVQINI